MSDKATLNTLSTTPAVDLESPDDGGCRFVVRVPSFDDGCSPRTVAASPGRGRVLRRPVAPAVT